VDGFRELKLIICHAVSTNLSTFFAGGEAQSTCSRNTGGRTHHSKAMRLPSSAAFSPSANDPVECDPRAYDSTDLIREKESGEHVRGL